MMERRLLLLFAIMLCFAVMTTRCEEDVAEKQAVTEELNRKGKVFSIFNIVTFKQGTCTTSTDSTMSGTCMTSSECSSAGGSSGGNCAAGFGVCCMFTAKCGTTTTVSRNSQYPSSASASTSCSYTFNRICNNLCQIRLDFTNFVSAPPPTSDVNTGSCTTGTDFLTVTSPTSASPPVVCGTLTGQHMYLETGTTGTAGTAVFTFGTATTSTRTFKVKVTYYTCDNKAKAPAGCVQYFTGTSGSFQTYNFQGGTVLQGQSYQTCIRQAQGFCSVSYSQDASTSPDPFAFYGPAVGAVPAISINAQATCILTYVMIPNTGSPAGTGRYCGGLLNPVTGQSNSGTVVGNISPFQIYTYSATITTANGAATSTAVTGYNLDYTQVPCSQ